MGSIEGPWHSRLSRRERQIMDILFRLGRAPASAVQAELPGDPNSSTVRTQLRILEQKGHVRHEEVGLRYVYRPVTPRRTARRSALRHLVETFFDGSAEQTVAALLGGEAKRLTEPGARADRTGRLGREGGATGGRSISGRVTRRRAERKGHEREAGGTVMSLLAVLTVKVSAILLLALIGTLLLRWSSASARHWVLAVGVVSAVAVPALHVLPTPPVVRMAPVGSLLLDALPPRLYVQFAEPADTGVVGSAVALQPADRRPSRSRPAAAAFASDDAVSRLAVTIWLLGAFAGLGVLLVGLARLRWLRASSSRVTDGRWHRLCADLSRLCGLTRGVDLLLGPRPGLVATWGWRRPVVMLPASAAEWSAERMRVVLLHELAHARRGDWMLQMAAEALRCVWWFNPLAWLVRARLRRESEHAADDLVLAHGVPAATCATHLVELAREVRKHRRTWLPAPAMARPSDLERRVSAMLNPRTNRCPLTRFVRFGSLGVLVLVLIVVAGLQFGPVSASRAVQSTGNAVEQEQPAESSSGRLTEFVPVAAAPAALQERVQFGSVSVSRRAEQEQPAEPSSEQVAEPVATATGLQEQHQPVLGEQQALLGDSDRLTGRSTEPIRVGPPSEARTGIQGGVVKEATIGPAGEVDDMEVVLVRVPIPGLDEADEGRGAPGARPSEADADDRSYRVLATRRASTLERELNAAAAVGYLQSAERAALGMGRRRSIGRTSAGVSMVAVGAPAGDGQHEDDSVYPRLSLHQR